jgi:hypothetical protein
VIIILADAVSEFCKTETDVDPTLEDWLHDGTVYPEDTLESLAQDWDELSEE